MILKKLFGFDPSVMKVKTEIMAGVTTFLTMSYILAVNPDILSAASMDRGAVFTATALAASFATLVMAILAKLPFALAPGMGLNAFFAFTLVQGMGYSWESALAAVFIEGLVFILLTVFNIRELIVNAIPETLRHAISVGIGLFIAFYDTPFCCPAVSRILKKANPERLTAAAYLKYLFSRPSKALPCLASSLAIS